MRFSLADLTRRQRNPRRSTIPIRPITAPAVQATNLYAAAYKPVIATWAASIDRIVATYERSLAQITTDSPADLRADIEAVSGEALAVIVSARTRLERWAQILSSWHTARWRRNVLAATGVDLGMMIGPGDVRTTLETVIERNVALVSSVSDQAKQRIADSVFRGLAERKPSREVAAEIREAVAMGRRRALGIASDQNNKLTGALNDERRAQAGIDSWFWVHSGKLHFRPEHLARDDNLYTDNPERVGQEYQGKTVKAPPPTLPAQEPYCGCTSRACLILE